MGEGSLRIPFTAGSSVAGGFHVSAALGGGPPHRFEVDTGSVGILVPRTVLGPGFQDFDPSQDEAFGLVSSGRQYRGQWVKVHVSLGVPDPWDGTGDYPVAEVEVFAADQPCDFTRGLLGIGFDIGNAADGGPGRNPLLNLTYQGSALSRTFVVGKDGIDVGLGSDLSGFSLVALARNEADSDWLKPTGRLSLPGGYARDLPILIDTGIPEMILWIRPGDRKRTDDGSSPPDGSSLADGEEVTISIPSRGSSDPQAFGYSFVTGDTTNPVAPSEVDWRNGPGSVNTGRRVLAGFDYLYDGGGGRIGFRATL